MKYLVCAPVNIDKFLGDFMPPYPFKDSEQIDCDDCKDKVYIGPQQKEFLDENTGVICFHCAGKKDIMPDDLNHIF